MPRQIIKHVLSHLLTPLLMCLGMGLAYQGAFHAPSPHHLKLAIVGTTPQTQVLAQTLKDKAGDALDVTTVPSLEDAHAKLMDRALVGAYVPDPNAPRLIVASANSDTSATVAEKVFSQVAGHSGKPLAVEDIAPTAKGDPTGQGLFFLLVAISIGSYGSAAVLGAAGGALAMRFRALLGLGTALAVSAIGAALAGPIFHIVDHDLVGLWALSLVYSAGVIAIGTALHSFLGRWTTLSMMVLFVMLNFTSSGGVFRPDLQNGFFGALHSFWNGAGFLEGARSMLYFHRKAGFSGHLTSLALWVVAGVALLLIAGAAERRRKPAAVQPVETAVSAEEEEIEETVAV